MKSLSEKAAADWCAANGLTLHHGLRLRYAGGLSTAIVAPLPGAPELVPWMVLDLLDVNVDDSSESLVWIKDWAVPADLILEMGLNLCDRLRRSYRIGACTEKEPAILFEPHESQAAATFGMSPALFTWDAYLMSGRGDRASLVTHEGFVCVLSKDECAQARHLKELARWKPEIQPIPRWA